MERSFKARSRSSLYDFQMHLIGCFVILACQRKLDLEYVLTYPLTPVPLSVCSTDGTMVKKNKSSLLELMENKAAPAVPGAIDAYVIYVIYLLHLPQHIPAAY